MSKIIKQEVNSNMKIVQFFKGNKTFLCQILVIVLIMSGLSSLNNYITIPLISSLMHRKINIFIALIIFHIFIGISYYSLKNFNDYHVEKKIQEYLLKKRMCILSNAYFKNSSVNISKLQNDLINNFIEMERGYFLPVFTVVQAIFEIAAVFITIMSINFLLSFFVLFSALLTLLIPKVIGKVMAKSVETIVTQKKYLTEKIAGWLPGLRLARNYKVENILYNEVLMQSKQLEDAKIAKTGIEQKSYFWIDNASNIIEVMLLTAIAFLVYRNYFSIGVYSAIGGFLYNLLGSMKAISNSLFSIKGTSIIRDQLEQQLVNRKQEELKEKQSIKTIKVTDLKVHYQNGETISFPDFKINKGEKILLTGDSGVGKSTLFRTFLGLEKNIEGKVEFINSNDKVVEPDLNTIGYIQQEPILFPGTIKDNITMFNDEVGLSDLINKRVKQMCFESDVINFSEGLNTPIKVGNYTLLSGGQRQKIILIRNSIFDRSIFLIDEATSAIDEKSRVKIIKEFLKTDATVIWIEHNLNKQIIDLFDRQINLSAS